MAKSKKEKSLEQRLDEALVRENEWPYKVPENWVWVKLEYIAQWGSGGTPSRNKKEYYNGTIKWIKTGELKNEIIFDTEEKITESGLKKSSAKLFPKNSVAVAMYGATIGQIGILGVEAATNQACAVAIPHKDILDHVYLFYYLISEKDNFIKLGKGGAQPNISQTIIKNYKSPLPPFGEQNRIVRKLSSMLAKLKEARELVQEAKDSFENRRATILNKAFTGELTKKWREENSKNENVSELIDKIIKKRKILYKSECKKAKEKGLRKPRKIFQDENPLIDYGIKTDIPNSWTHTNIGFLGHVTKLAGFEYSKYINYREMGEISIVRAQNVHMGNFIDDNIVYIDKVTSDLLERSQLHGREILMVFIGAGTGNVCMAAEGKRWHLGPNVAKIDVDSIFAEYLNYYLQSPIGQANIKLFIKATAQPSLSMGTIRKVVVNLAPLDEQKEIVRILKNLFSNEDEAEDLINMKSQIDLIEKSILSKAFRCELGTNNSEDEPAIKLLKRILMLFR